MALKPNFLKLSYLDDGDLYSCGLAGEVRVGHFAGVGEAWFGRSELANFLSDLETFSKTLSGNPCIRGGFWNREKPDEIEQVNLSLSFYTYSLSGKIGVRIDLADDPHTYRREEEVSRIQTELKTVPGMVDRFIKEARYMLRERDGFAILEGGDD
ncbi:MAG: hypothetical protein ACREUW_11865 [Burkholderiales bacterium]